MTIDRRSFLKAGLTLPMAAATVPALFSRALWAAEPGDKVLVLLQLQGGNDGLNTVIPYEDDLYHRLRPGLRVPENQVVRLADGVGLHPALEGLRAAWDDGGLAVLQGVGYENPNRSHFTSTDIWQSARMESGSRNTGWVGRAIDADAARARGGVPGVQLDDGPLSLALIGEDVVVPSVRDASRFGVRGGQRASTRFARLAEGKGGSPQLQYIRGSARQAYRMAGSLERALESGKGEGAYPKTPLGKRLWQIARLVESGLATRVYGVRLGGFDTHARQRPAHDQLLRVVGDSVAAFHRDLKASGLSDRVLLLSYSEFGRRVKENRSLGTDHGAAAPLFAVGGGVNGGIHGAHPSLADLVDGDLKYHTDFRQVYAAVLQRWLGADAKAILGAEYKPVPFV